MNNLDGGSPALSPRRVGTSVASNLPGTNLDQEGTNRLVDSLQIENQRMEEGLGLNRSGAELNEYNDNARSHSQDGNAIHYGYNDPEMELTSYPLTLNYDNRQMSESPDMEHFVELQSDSDPDSVEAYRRPRPEGSPAFHQNRPNMGSQVTNNSVVFSAVRALNFSEFDDADGSTEIIPHGSNRSVSTPSHKSQHYAAEDLMSVQERDYANSGENQNVHDFGQTDAYEKSEPFTLFSPLAKHTQAHEEVLGYQENYTDEVKQNRHDQYLPISTTGFVVNSSPVYHNSHRTIERNVNHEQIGNGLQISRESPQQQRNDDHYLSESAGFVSQSPQKISVQVNVPQGLTESPLNSSIEKSPNNRGQEIGDSTRAEQLEPGNEGFSKTIIDDNAKNRVTVVKTGPQSALKPNMQNGGSKSVHTSNVKTNSRENLATFQSKPSAGFRPSHVPQAIKKVSQGADLKQTSIVTQTANAGNDVSKVKNAGTETRRPAQAGRKTTVPSDTKTAIRRTGYGGLDRNSKAKSDVELNRKPTSTAAAKQKTDQAHGSLDKSQKHVSGMAVGGNDARLNVSPGQKPEDLRVVTQVEQMGDDLEQVDIFLSQKEGLDNHDLTLDVQGMEEVRHQLQGMLRISSDVLLSDKKSFDHASTDPVSGLLMNTSQDPDISRGGTDFSSLYGHPKAQDEVSELLENFPSFTSHMWTDTSNVSRNEVSLQTENQRLREVLEKERYRRKHCEQYIQQLNCKLLETQQQLAVAVSTDKRKDIMIEQLDRQLAKVVEGWKKREMEKDDFIDRVKKEKTKIEDTLRKQQEMIQNFERDLADAVEELRQEKGSSALEIETLKTEMGDKEREKLHAEELLEAERERCQLMTQEWEHVRESRETADRKIQQLQDRLHTEQDEWFKREQELLQKISDVSENNMKIVQQEKDKGEELIKMSETMQEELVRAQTQLKRFEMELDAAVREKESLKVEIGIMESKFENSHKKLEADLHSEMEREIATQVEDVQKKMQKAEDELCEKHRHQVQELSQRHGKELERQLAQFHDEFRNKEDSHRKQLQEYEEKLQEYRNENSTLKLTKQKLESQRTEVLSKLQYTMQSQWNEAVSLLAGTPQRKNGNFSYSNPFQAREPSVTGPGVGVSSPSRAVPQTSSPGRESVISNFTVKSDMLQQPMFGDIQGALANQEAADIITSMNIEEYLQSLSRHQSKGLAPAGEARDVMGSNSTGFVPHINEGSQFVESGGGQMLGILDIDGAFQSAARQGHRSENSRERTHSGYVPTQTAIPIRPPQQHEGKAQNSRFQSLLQNSHNINTDDGIQPLEDGRKDDYEMWQSHQPMSPPTKQSRSKVREETRRGQADDTDEDTEVEDIVSVLDESAKLHTEYSHLSDKVDLHESRQGELHHYIQLLLNRPPGSPVPEQNVPHDQNMSLFSHDQTGEDLDLTGSAQAAQLQKEMRRIQELREKQVGGIPVQKSGTQNRDVSGKQKDSSQDMPVPLGVLQPEQLAEISRLLGQYKGQWESGKGTDGGEQVSDLINVLKDFQSRNPQKGQQRHYPDQRGMRRDPKAAREEKMRGMKGHRNLSPVAAERSQQTREDGVDRTKANQTKRPDRKIASAVKQAPTKSSGPKWK